MGCWFLCIRPWILSLWCLASGTSDRHLLPYWLKPAYTACWQVGVEPGTSWSQKQWGFYHLYYSNVTSWSPHAYADDIQIYGFCRPSSVNCLADRVSACIDEVSSWMRSNWLQVNPLKTEVLWCSSSRRQHQIPTSPVRIGSTYVLLSIPFVISGST